ncbi:hypothetical protein [Microcystis phage vB_MweS-yong2]|nr:hypothetical protein [Microcystis phage vB_MweS-yong2]
MPEPADTRIRVAIVVNGVVDNVVMADPRPSAPLSEAVGTGPGETAIATDVAGTGWLHDPEGGFSPPAE